MKFIFTIMLLFIASTSYANSSVTDQALVLLKQLESSNFGYRHLCVVGNNVYAIIPASHWSLPSSLAEGSLEDFPQKVTLLEDPQQSPVYIQISGEVLLDSIDGVDFYKAPGLVVKATRMTADVCVFESKVLAE